MRWQMLYIGIMPAIVAIACGSVPSNPDDNIYTATTVRGFAWFDADGNGLQTDDEEGIPNTLVQLLDASRDKVIEETRTDEHGAYMLTSIEDPMEVFFTLPPDYQQLEFTTRDVGINDTIDSDVAKSGLTGVFTTEDTLDEMWSAGVLPLFIQTETGQESDTDPELESQFESDLEDANERYIEQTDPADGCQDLNAAGQFECNADIVRFEAAFDELANQLVFTFVYAVPIDLSLLDSCVGFDLDKDPTTGDRTGFDIGADVVVCVGAQDSGAFVARYAANGSFAGANDLNETEAKATEDTDPETGLTRIVTLVVDPDAIDQDALNATLQAQIFEPPTKYDATDPILSPAAEQGQ